MLLTTYIGLLVNVMQVMLLYYLVSLLRLRVTDKHLSTSWMLIANFRYTVVETEIVLQGDGMMTVTIRIRHPCNNNNCIAAKGLLLHFSEVLQSTCRLASFSLSLTMHKAVVAFGALASLCLAEDIDFIRDPGVYGPALETVHAFYNQWPTGKVTVHNTSLVKQG